MLSPYFCHSRRLVFDQSSQVHPISEFRGGGTVSIMEDGRTDKGQKLLFLILDYNFCDRQTEIHTYIRTWQLYDQSAQRTESVKVKINYVYFKE